VSQSLPEAFGPPPFRFSASAGSVEGPAFTRAYQVLVVAMVIIASAWWVRLWQQGHWGDQPGRGGGLFLLAIVLMAWTGWGVLRSRTRLDADGISQSWIWNKHMPCRELAYARLIRVRGLEWLMAPRLYVRTLLGKFAVFYIADAQVLAQAELLVKELAEFRRPT
jgi:hypothetical protein